MAISVGRLRQGEIKLGFLPVQKAMTTVYLQLSNRLQRMLQKQTNGRLNC